MRTLGIDIGSRTVDAVWLDDGRVAESAIEDSGFDPLNVTRELVERGSFDRLVVTGYGRHSARETWGATVVTEIKAYAKAAATLFPDAACVLDIGGQDTKVIALRPGGGVVDFEMNDKCAAGTGRFLEVMASALGYSLQEMAEGALTAESGAGISSMCTVFAESEVTGLVHRGEDRGRIARGLHEAAVRRTLGSLKRVGACGPLVFAGGVAQNSAMIALLEAEFAHTVLVPEHPQLVGALGAALAGCDADAPG